VLPKGVVNYLMTDVVGSTRLWEANAVAMGAALSRHDELAAEIVERHHGILVKERGEGDSLFVVFDAATDAVVAARDLQAAIMSERWPGDLDFQVRIAVHSGASIIREHDYYGPEVNRCARLRGIASGGQILVSESTIRLMKSTPDDLELRDLGRHRLRDLLRPERVSEVVLSKTNFGRVHSLDEVNNNLPIQLTTFIGREDDIMRVRAMLQTSRLITLVGAGGAGKTRLSLQIAAESTSEFRRAIWFVDFSSLKGGEDLVGFTALAIGIKADRENLHASLRGGGTLLIVDNCEQIVDEAAAFVLELLQACPELVVLATSREALQLPGEVRTVVPPLSTPKVGASLEDALATESVKLFFERAILRKPVFEIDGQNVSEVCELCRLLDGIPLAIEQAASNITFMTPFQMVSKFSQSLAELGSSERGLTARHRTLYAAINWSFEGLSVEEQDVFCRCSVFVGGWTPGAAEVICQGRNAALALQKLADKSLVITEERDQMVRYQMLQSIRDFASSQCVDESAAEEAHAAYFADLAADNQLTVATASAEHFNLMKAIEWLLAHDERRAITMILGLRSYFIASGQLESGYRLMQVALKSDLSVSERATVLNVIGAVHYRREECETAEAYFRESMALWSELGNSTQRAMVLHNLGLCLVSVGKHRDALPLIREAADVYRNSADDTRAAACDLSLGRALLDLGDCEGAKRLFCVAIAELREKEPVRMSVACANMAMALVLQNETSEALEYLEKGAGFVSETQDYGSLSPLLAIAAIILDRGGHEAEASESAAVLAGVMLRHGTRLNKLEADLVSHLEKGTNDLASLPIGVDQILNRLQYWIRIAAADVTLR
jgi:predicted ATPase/class 3 adenylate cyclase